MQKQNNPHALGYNLANVLSKIQIAHSLINDTYQCLNKDYADNKHMQVYCKNKIDIYYRYASILRCQRDKLQAHILWADVKMQILDTLQNGDDNCEQIASNSWIIDFCNTASELQINGSIYLQLAKYNISGDHYSPDEQGYEIVSKEIQHLDLVNTSGDVIHECTKEQIEEVQHEIFSYLSNDIEAGI